jgi:hypothetical protein
VERKHYVPGERYASQGPSSPSAYVPAMDPLFA